MLKGKYISIDYKGDLVCSGMIKSVKHNAGTNKLAMLLVSIDDKYYFNLYHKDIIYTIQDKVVDTIINIKDLPSTLWRNIQYKPNMPLYEEYTIKELDKEVTRLVNALNNIDYMSTIGSCSGHFINDYYIDFSCVNFETLISFLSLFSYNGLFAKDWKVSTDVRLLNDDNKEVKLRLKCNYKGIKAFRCADKLACYLEAKGEI